jgi:hypothetical protein
VKRGIALLSDGEVLIQDQLKGVRPGSRVRWQMVTTGVADDLGHNPIVLHQRNERLTLTAVAPAKVNWAELDTAKSRHEWDSPNPGTSMMAFEIRAPESGSVSIAVVATPGSCRFAIGAKAKFEPLETWGDKLRTTGN